eukprot:CAMPEP_0182875932 /NCGR_PEP_ID=MMETSP0034_2-20130328/13832_1 /TAXON_ID=156128 /ORGANISM="Nephroselmis pyriformis, Strain CCMP717" /LENGTH=384 /DNA_ID=CAMNT_0025008691 /DNA_START=28 /DNA_END=1182 /DNA_ORIENTATION=+
MSTIGRYASLDENAALDGGGKGVAGRVPLMSTGSRRALGDIGNMLGGSARMAASKDGPSKAGALTDRATRSTRSSYTGTAKSMSSILQSRSEAASARKPQEPTSPMPDIDKADTNNPLCVTEYINDIYTYYHHVEGSTKVAEGYMTQQADINDKMRAILIDWLVEVHLKFKLMPETLFLTVNLIDRFLEKKQVTRKNLQLVGITAMLLASKYEEIWAPEVRDFVYISDKAYTRDQILAMEKQMLNTLKFNLTVPTPYSFLTRFLKAAGGDKQTEMLAQFLVELSLPDYSMVKHKGSTLAAAAVYTAQRTLGKPAWSHALERHSRHSEADIREAANSMAALQRKASGASLLAVHKKYSNPKYLEVAKLPAPVGLGDDHVGSMTTR